MSYERLHLLYVDEGQYGWSLSSPQMPGLIYGAPTITEFEAGIPELLEAYDAPNLPHQKHYVGRSTGTTTGLGFRLRIPADGSPLRYKIASQLAAALMEPAQEAALLARAPQNPTGDLEFVVTLGSDQLGWIYEQLIPEDGVVALVGHLNQGRIWNDFVHTGPPAAGMVDLESLGLSLHDTVDDARARKVLVHEVDGAFEGIGRVRTDESPVEMDDRVLVHS